MDYKEALYLFGQCKIVLLDPKDYGDSEHRCLLMQEKLKAAARKEIKWDVVRKSSPTGDPNKDQYRCPVCGRRLRCTTRDAYCPSCGQALEWTSDGRYL